MPDRSTSRDYVFWISNPIRSATHQDNSVTHNALTQTAPTQLSTPWKLHQVLYHLGELPRFSQPLHCPHKPITPIAYPTLTIPATLDHDNATNHTRPPHLVNGPQATPTTPLTGTAKPSVPLQSSDHHLRNTHHLAATSTVPASFRAAEQHAHLPRRLGELRVTEKPTCRRGQVQHLVRRAFWAVPQAPPTWPCAARHAVPSGCTVARPAPSTRPTCTRPQ